MECPNCQFENPEKARFCGECGAQLEKICPKCRFSNLPQFKFCGQCGQKLNGEKTKERILPGSESERKHVAVLFSDLSGYTALSEKLDPEEVREITRRIYSDISEIVAKYEGFIEKYAGDSVMALFGVPRVHEDDPIRAIKAAREIHQHVDEISRELSNDIGQAVSMHSGINTGLVVTGEVNMKLGIHGVAGDTINLASRLCDLAGPGEVLLDADTHRQAEGHFIFEALKPVMLKGKAEPVAVYRVLAQRDKPVTIHRLSGLRAELTGRKVELAELGDGIENLRKGQGQIFSIWGEAGTGKSRLIEEFRESLNLKEIQWVEGHAYAYSQNIPYSPLIDLLNRVLGIEENDPAESVREKIETGIKQLTDEKHNLIPYIGGLYALRYPETEGVSPEFWKSHLQEAIRVIFEGLAERAPTVFFFEDLHWADPSSVELLRRTCLEIRQPAIFLCAYRPSFSLFTSHQLSSLSQIYHGIQLQNLSFSEAQDMLESLLKTDRIPSDLKRLVQNRAEGNPFYLEELVNTLIESETLVQADGNWKIARPISEHQISSSIHGLISGRLNNLENEAKRILQEASVIGRAFLYEILKKITEFKDCIDSELKLLERSDLIRTRTLQPDLEYMFKHPLTQEVVYNGLLKKERQEIHEQIARVMESLFQERLPEFYETLAFHFKQGRSVLKAVDYLIRSGEKSLARYAVQESHQYFKEAFELLSNKAVRTKDEDALLIDLLIKWSLVYYYRGDSRGQDELLSAHKELAESLEDRAMLGMFYAWYGWTVWFREKYQDSYTYLHRALEIGEQLKDQRLIGYACNWLSWTYAELGELDKAIEYGERAQAISKHIPSDQYLYFKSLGAIGYTSFYKGDRKRTRGAGTILLEFGQKHSNIRSMVMGHFMITFSFLIEGDFPSAVEAVKKAVQTSQDPLYDIYSRFLMGICYAKNGLFQEAEQALLESVACSRNLGCECIATPTRALLGLIAVVGGRINEGLTMMEEALETELKAKRKFWNATIGHVMGQVYLQLTDEIVPAAAKRAEAHLTQALKVAKEIGAKGIEGQIYPDLARLYEAQGRGDQVRDLFSRAVQIFEECEAAVYLNKAKEAMVALEVV